MSAQRLAIRYAQSLHDLSLEKGKHDTIHGDMKLLLQTTNESRELSLMLKSPIVRIDKKARVLHQIFDDKVDDITVKFIDIIINKGREDHFVNIAKSFIDLYNQHNKITPVKVTTAVEVNDDTHQRIEQALINQTYIERVEMSTQVKEDIIGGFVLHFDDKLYDASIAHKLNEVKKELTN